MILYHNPTRARHRPEYASELNQRESNDVSGAPYITRAVGAPQEPEVPIYVGRKPVTR
jgi:hypothetical protein